MNLRGDIEFLPGHIFRHHTRRCAVRAWRQRYGATLNFQTRLSVFGWQFRFEGNRTMSNRKWGGSAPQ